MFISKETIGIPPYKTDSRGNLVRTDDKGRIFSPVTFSDDGDMVIMTVPIVNRRIYGPPEIKPPEHQPRTKRDIFAPLRSTKLRGLQTQHTRTNEKGRASYT